MINLALVIIDGWLSNQYGASHQAYEIQVSSLTRSLAQMEEQLRLANEDRVSLQSSQSPEILKRYEYLLNLSTILLQGKSLLLSRWIWKMERMLLKEFQAWYISLKVCTIPELDHRKQLSNFGKRTEQDRREQRDFASQRNQKTTQDSV